MMEYLNWMGDHPVLTVILFYIVFQSIVWIAVAICGKRDEARAHEGTHGGPNS